MRKKPLTLFFLLAFAISWGVSGLGMLAGMLFEGFTVSLGPTSPFTYIAVWAPMLAAFITIFVTDGWAGLKAYGKRCLTFTGHWGWYAGVIFGIPVVFFTAAALAQALGQDAIQWPSGAWLGAFLLVNLQRGTQGPFEELGWRGYALPMLQRKHPAWRAALILGLFWAVWHFPALLMDSLMSGSIEGGAVWVLVRFMINILITSFLMTIVYNGSKGSIPLLFLYHWLINVYYPWEPKAGIPGMQDAVSFAVLVVLVSIFGTRYLGTKNRVNVVIEDSPKDSIRPFESHSK